MTALELSRTPVVLAPMAGGPGTVTLAAAVAGAGGLGFLPGAYLGAARLEADLAALRALTTEPFGVNLFVPSVEEPGMAAAAAEYAALLAPWAAAAGVELGEARHSDDDFDAKVEVLVAAAPAVVSFAFAWPPAEVVRRLQRAGSEVWVTVNEPAEAQWAVELGVDALVAQGWEAGGHRGGPVDSGREQPSVRQLVAGLRERTGLPIVAAGGLASGGDIAQVLALGASAAAVGTAFLRCPEAGTAGVHAHALAHREGTVVTRAFTGRSGRALATTWTELFSEAAPAAYPHVHFVTAPLRALGKELGQAELVHLWAGTAHASARSVPAAEVVRTLLSELAASPG